MMWRIRPIWRTRMMRIRRTINRMKCTTSQIATPAPATCPVCENPFKLCGGSDQSCGAILLVAMATRRSV